MATVNDKDKLILDGLEKGKDKPCRIVTCAPLQGYHNPDWEGTNRGPYYECVYHTIDFKVDKVDTDGRFCIVAKEYGGDGMPKWTCYNIIGQGTYIPIGITDPPTSMSITSDNQYTVEIIQPNDIQTTSEGIGSIYNILQKSMSWWESMLSPELYQVHNLNTIVSQENPLWVGYNEVYTNNAGYSMANTFHNITSDAFNNYSSSGGGAIVTWLDNSHAPWKFKTSSDALASVSGGNAKYRQVSPRAIAGGFVPNDFDAKSVNKYMVDSPVWFKNIIVTRSEDEGRKYIEDGTIPSDAELIDSDGNKISKRDEPTGENDGSKTDERDETPTQTSVSTESGIHAYNLSTPALKLLFDNINSGDWMQEFEEFFLATYSSSMSSILSIIKFPLSSDYFNHAGHEYIRYGKVTTDINATTVTSITPVVVGSIEVNEKYNSFIDYAPYTEILLYLPYCGIIRLDTNTVMGTTLQVELAVDYLTGMGTYFIHSDGSIINEQLCQIGVNIPITLENWGSVSRQIAENGLQIASAIAGTVASGGALAPIGASMVMSGLTVDTPPLSITGSTSGLSGTCAPNRCCLIRSVPNYNRPSNYGFHVGYPSNVTRKLSTLNGFTMVANAKIEKFDNGSPTETEYNEIINMLEKGVIL